MDLGQIIGRILLVGVFVSVLLLTADPAFHVMALLFGVGGCCNILVVIANGGRMPVQSGKFVKDYAHIAVSSRTKLRFLCDRFRVAYRRRSMIISLGDMLIFLAILVELLKVLRVV